MHPNTSYATMAGSICLDKFMDAEGSPAPITFSVRKVINGNKPWSQQGGNMTLYQGADTLAWAVKELFHRFEMEMQERGYTLLLPGDTAELPNDDGDIGQIVFAGGGGWYRDTWDTDGGPDYAIAHHPLKWEDWVKKAVHSFSYDNYTVCIVTSNGDLVH